MTETLRLFTSESVTEGHPDKLCDQISDAVLDAILEQDRDGRVAVETMAAPNHIILSGEINTTAVIDVDKIVRDTVQRIGYDDAATGLDYRTVTIINLIGQQSAEIAGGVNTSLEARTNESVDELDLQGAGDQGIMFGYATNETPELMPLPILLSHRIAERLSILRKDGTLPFLRPDAKTQVTIGYDQNNVPVTVDTVVISTQHGPGISQEFLREILIEQVILPVITDHALGELHTADAKYIINPGGDWQIGGPASDAGLTGRKIIVDTYGGASRHGGGNFQGKDASKVDRSGAYALRWVAKNVVSAGFADRVEIQVAYALGQANPVGVYVEAFGTEHIPVELIQKAILQVFDLRPAAIIRDLHLKDVRYAPTAAYGHFGRELTGFTWEETNRVSELLNSLHSAYSGDLVAARS